MPRNFDPNQMKNVSDLNGALVELEAQSDITTNPEHKKELLEDIKEIKVMFHKLVEDTEQRNVVRSEELTINPNTRGMVYRRYVKKKELDRIKYLALNTLWPAYYRDGRYVRSYRGSRSKFLKKVSNKVVRKADYDLLRGKNADYRLIYDFWYELY